MYISDWQQTPVTQPRPQLRKASGWGQLPGTLNLRQSSCCLTDSCSGPLVTPEDSREANTAYFRRGAMANMALLARADSRPPFSPDAYL